MENAEIQKSNPFTIAGTVEYLPGSVNNRIIFKKITGTINVVAFATGEFMPIKVSPFDTFIQIIDGQAEITIDDRILNVEKGESIIVPAHSPSGIKANMQFKMLSTVIKSGYEEVY